MTLTVKVRPQPEDSTNMCTADPVAQALREAVGHPRCTAATGRRIEAMAQPSRLFARNNAKGLMVKCETPKRVRDWILRWDETGQGEAFDFEVETVPIDLVNAGYLIPGAQQFGNG